MSSLGSITKLLELCELFGHASGARLNVSKCFGIWLGRFKGLVLDSFQGISFQPCGKILGIVHGIGDMHEENWSKTYEKFKSSIETNMEWKLTFKGKAVLLNSKCATKLWYVGAIKTLSSHGLDIVNKAIHAFLGNGGMAQIRRDTLEQPHCKCGIALVNIKLKLEAFLIRHIVRFLQDDFHPWKVFARYWVGLQLKCYRKEVFLPGPHSESEMPEFYSVCLGLFKDFRRSFPDVPLDQLTVKKMYQLLLDKIFERPRVEYDISLPCQKVQCIIVDHTGDTDDVGCSRRHQS